MRGLRIYLVLSASFNVFISYPDLCGDDGPGHLLRKDWPLDDLQDRAAIKMDHNEPWVDPGQFVTPLGFARHKLKKVVRPLLIPTCQSGYCGAVLSMSTSCIHEDLSTIQEER